MTRNANDLVQRLPALERPELAVTPDDRRQAELEMEVRGAAVHSRFQKSVQVHGQTRLTIGNPLLPL
jgi:hypothetical protein